LGSFNVPELNFSGSIQANQSTTNAIPFLGNFERGGSFTVPDTGRGTGDQPFVIGLSAKEKVTVTPEGEDAETRSNLSSQVRQLAEVNSDQKELLSVLLRVAGSLDRMAQNSNVMRAKNHVG
jgi:hypothetical protein